MVQRWLPGAIAEPTHMHGSCGAASTCPEYFLHWTCKCALNGMLLPLTNSKQGGRAGSCHGNSAACQQAAQRGG